MRLDECILSFTEWHRPWRFEKAVLSVAGPLERERFRRVWAEATDASHWAGPDLESCGAAARARLREAFPELSEAALGAVVGAGAYQWK